MKLPTITHTAKDHATLRTLLDYRLSIFTGLSILALMLSLSVPRGNPPHKPTVPDTSIHIPVWAGGYR